MEKYTIVTRNYWDSSYTQTKLVRGDNLLDAVRDFTARGNDPELLVSVSEGWS